MLFKVLALAALTSVAFGQAGQTFTNPDLPSCSISCLEQMQSILGCDPNLLTCTCPPLVDLVSNQSFENCLLTNCGAGNSGNVGYALGKNCGLYAWTVSTLPTTGSMPMISAPAASGTAVNDNPAATSATSAPAGAASPTKSANAAARSDAGVAAMGLAIAAVFVL